MKIYYQENLVSRARKLRQSGNVAEVLLWNEIKNKKLRYRFLRQRPIGKYIVDFYCPALNLAIEIDGAASHDCKIEYDKERQKEIESLGIKFVRFADKDVRSNLEGILLLLKEEILRPS